MTFKEYEAHAASTACYAKEVAIPYVVMGLTNELAEVLKRWTMLPKQRKS